MPAPARTAALLRLLLAALAAAFLATACPEPPGPPDEQIEEGEDAGETEEGSDAQVADAAVEWDAGITGPAVTFKVMDWNVHDFFDTIDAAAYRDDVLTASELNAKVSKLAKVIKAASPDVLALQEVENEALLTRLNTALAPLSLPNVKLIPTRDPRGINVALMSRFPITNAISHASDRLFAPDGYGPLYYSRDCLEVHLDVGGNRRAVVLVNHQISQLEDSTNSERKRQAQALRTREIGDALLREIPGRPVIITGDMNDEPSSATMNLYFSGGAFVDIGTRVGSTDRWTYRYSGDKLRFDYIIPDKASSNWVKSVQFVHGTDVTAASDHEPAVMTMTYP